MSDQTNLLLIFITGLTTGGLSCLLVQGGLLASIISNKQKSLKKAALSDQALPLINFLVSKLVVHLLLGALLGAVGSVLRPSPIVTGYLQIAIAIYLVGVALSLLDVHPFFRHFIITPPKFLARLAKNQSKSNSWFAPILLGAFTVFIPCGTTQAMEIIALGTGNPLYGAAVMGAFVLGTSPTFFILGFIYQRLSTLLGSWFYKLSALLLIVMAIITLNGGLALTGSIYTLQNFYQAFITDYSKPVQVNTAKLIDGYQEVTINVYSSGYSPNTISIKKGVSTKLHLETNQTQGCSRAFTIPSLGISKVLPTTGSTTIEFVPLKSGPLAFSCSMGMYTGIFNVI